MTRRVYKYPLRIVETQEIQLPVGAAILSVQRQRALVLWAAVDPDARLETRTFHVLGTGWDLPEYAYPERLVYVDTVQIDGLVWHVFSVERYDRSIGLSVFSRP